MGDEIDVTEEFKVAMQKYHELFAQAKYKEAAVLAGMALDKSIKKLYIIQTERNYGFTKINQLYDKNMAGPSREIASVTEFTHEEIMEATNNFHMSNKIGEGGYGIVYKGSLRHTTVAIKLLGPHKAQGVIEFHQEVEILSKVRHPNLVSLIGASKEDRALVYEYLPNGSLDTYLTNKKSSHKKLTWQDRIRIASEMCSALIFLHSIKPHGIAHGDLKPANVLLDSNFLSKLTDFGVSRELQQSTETITPFHKTEFPKGTLAYIDPEYLAYGELTPQSDVFAFGIILLQFVTGRDPRALRDSVKQAMEKKKLEKEHDGSCKWPKKEAMELAKLGLECSDPMRRHRPDLEKYVWPVLESLKHAAGIK